MYGANHLFFVVFVYCIMLPVSWWVQGDDRDGNEEDHEKEALKANSIIE